MNNIPEKLIPIGKVLKPHGVKGELKISVFENDVEILIKGIDVWFESNNSYKNYKLEYIKGFSKNMIVKLNQINNRNTVEAFLNKQLFISRKDFLKSGNNNYHISDLIGLKIFDENNNTYGLVLDAIKLPGNDIIVFIYKEKEIMVPVVEYFIELFDFKSKMIKIKNIKSLLEL